MSKNDWAALNTTISTLNWLDTRSANSKLDQIKSDISSQQYSVDSALKEQQRFDREKMRAHVEQLNNRQIIFELRTQLDEIDTLKNESEASKYWRTLNLLEIMNGLSTADFNEISDKEYFVQTQKKITEIKEKLEENLKNISEIISSIKEDRKNYYNSHKAYTLKGIHKIFQEGNHKLKQLNKKITLIKYLTIIICILLSIGIPLSTAIITNDPSHGYLFILLPLLSALGAPRIFKHYREKSLIKLTNSIREEAHRFNDSHGKHFEKSYINQGSIEGHEIWAQSGIRSAQEKLPNDTKDKSPEYFEDRMNQNLHLVKEKYADFSIAFTKLPKTTPTP